MFFYQRYRVKHLTEHFISLSILTSTPIYLVISITFTYIFLNKSSYLLYLPTSSVLLFAHILFILIIQALIFDCVLFTIFSYIIFIPTVIIIVILVQYTLWKNLYLQNMFLTIKIADWGGSLISRCPSWLLVGLGNGDCLHWSQFYSTAERNEVEGPLQIITWPTEGLRRTK